VGECVCVTPIIKLLFAGTSAATAAEVWVSQCVCVCVCVCGAPIIKTKLLFAEYSTD